jgi:dihydrofolate synthase/folylpolyglutamate synthase
MDFDQAVRYMSHLRRFGIKLGNERMREFLRRIGDPHTRYQIAHVTGTKGKGSTTALIAAILTAHGFRTGGYYSPYVYDVRERVQLDGCMIPCETMAAIITEFVPLIEELAQGPFGQVTEFELKTALGFRYFEQADAEYAAVEVGMGGRLDATNVVMPDVSVITNVGLDHTDVLGTTHREIAFEKAGIIKDGVPVVTAADHPDALEVIREQARVRNADVVQVQEGAERPPAGFTYWHGCGDAFTIRTTAETYDGLRLRLVGRHQRINAACAVSAVEAIAAREGWTARRDLVREACAEVALPGRFSILAKHPMVVADGAHNAMAARVLADELRTRNFGRLLLVVGMVRGHDPRSFMAEVCPIASVVFATEPSWRRAQSAEAVADAALDYCDNVHVVTPPLDAARAAVAMARDDDLVLITGSFYTVGEVRAEDLFS